MTVAITGMGVKSPVGLDLASFWSGLCAGTSAAGPITQFDTSEHPVTFACEIPSFDVGQYLSPKEAAHLDRVTHLGFAAAVDALAQAGDLGADPARIAVVAGTGVGGLITLETEIMKYAAKGAMRVSPFLVPMMMSNATAAFIALQHGFTGPNFSVVTACAAGANAIGEAARLLRAGDADVVIAGGSESSITPVGLAAFNRMGALSRRKDDPSSASRPFDADRDGFVMGEGAGFLVLESLDRAVGRGATVFGVVAGYGRNTDAFHITAPSPGGEGAVRCMQLALEDAGLTPADIGHVNAHGTSTPLNDAAEAEAVAKVFGGSTPPVTSVKGATGHLIGAAGAVEAIASVLSFQHGAIWPTANYTTADPALPAIDVVHGAPRPLPAAPALSNSFGFGGHNASLVLVPRVSLLEGKRLVITGVLNDDSIAFHVAKRAQEEGAEIVLTSFGRVMSITQRVARRLPAPVDVLTLDVSSAEDHDALAATLRERWESVDGVVHAIGFAPASCLGGGFLDAPWEDVATALQVSAYSLKSLAVALAPLMPPGSSVVGLDFDATVAWPGYDWMGVAKAALESCARYLARDLGPLGIRVNLVAAGPIRTVAAKSIPGFNLFEDVWDARAPLGWDVRDVAPVAAAAVALLSDLFPATTGEIVHVDGGFHTTGA